MGYRMPGNSGGGGGRTRGHGTAWIDDGRDVERFCVQSCDAVLLSEYRPYEKPGIFMWNAEWGEAAKSMAGEVHMYVLMLVERCVTEIGTFYRRLGLAVMLPEEWERLEPTPEWVILG